MTARQVALANEIAAYVRATLASRNKDVSVLQKGYLFKATAGGWDWQRRYFVLDSTGTLHWYSTGVSQRVGRGGIIWAATCSGTRADGCPSVLGTWDVGVGRMGGV